MTFLENIGLKRKVSISVSSGKRETLEIIEKNLDSKYLLPNFLEAFSMSINGYEGEINGDSFHLSRKRKFFNILTGHSRIKGTVSHEKTTIITAEANLRTMSFIGLLFIPLVVLLILIDSGINGEVNGDISDIVIFFVGISIIELIMYFLLSKSIESELDSFTKEILRWIKE